MSQEPTSRKQVQNYQDIKTKYKNFGSDDSMENVVVKKVVNLQAEKLIKSTEGE